MPNDDAHQPAGAAEQENRHQDAELRDQAARQRDLAGALRDTAGEQRDTIAEQRDRSADTRLTNNNPSTPDHPAPDTHGPTPTTPTESAATDRANSGSDRAAAAGDRHAAAHDRILALANRTASAQDRHHASLDGLTGVYNREAGLLELERELARVKRTGHPLVLAFVDVDQLKAINDHHGHAAGDQLLTAVAHALTAALRPYDLVIRYGGDEFLCAVQGIDLTAAGPRFARINTLLAQTPGHGSVTIGLAQMRHDDSTHTLIARADTHLYGQRQT